MQQFKSAFHLPPNMWHVALMQELGVHPMSVWVDMRLLEMWRRVINMEDSRLVKKVGQAGAPPAQQRCKSATLIAMLADMSRSTTRTTAGHVVSACGTAGGCLCKTSCVFLMPEVHTFDVQNSPILKKQGGKETML
jgi:hypothetical protein